MNQSKFREGLVDFYAPEGEPTKQLPVFYNPLMEFDRNITIAVLKAYGKKNAKYCDLLSGSGIRGLRAAGEAACTSFCNDGNPKAVKLVKKNARLNNLKISISNKDANLLLTRHEEGIFDVIDIDPFGSFMPFLYPAIDALYRKDGMLFLTATDTAPLCGSAIKACLRRYSARPLKTAYCKEIGLRILIARVVMAGAERELNLMPAFSYNRRHYFRLYMQASTGLGKLDANLKKIKYLQHCFSCSWRDYVQPDAFYSGCPVCGKKLQYAGPLWTGEFASSGFAKKTAKHLQGKEKMLVETIASEQKITIPFYDVHKLSKLASKPSPPMEEILQRFSGVKTHFSGNGVRTKEKAFL